MAFSELSSGLRQDNHFFRSETVFTTKMGRNDEGPKSNNVYSLRK